MSSLRLAGASRAGIALAGAAARAGIVGAGVWTPNPDRPGRPRPEDYGQFAIDAAALGAPGADLLILGVRDDALAELARSLAGNCEGLRASGTLVIHLSGSRDRSVLEPLAARGIETGALHPMRAFPRPEPGLDLEGTWFALERAPTTNQAARALVARLGGRLLEVAAEAKGRHHLACSLASNAVVVLLDALDGLRRAAGVRDQDRAAYVALFRAAITAWESEGAAALSGPWTRGDLGTVARHLELAEQEPGLAGLYRALVLRALADRPDLPGAAGLIAALEGRS
ncbi:MAG: DUF2520 domain-containing protein [Planctomycetes bacterium]|nr:DUF2520 domain-containing protein [Planctomycetota bacterium]